jgi:hypothetical membrane-anchored protein
MKKNKTKSFWITIAIGCLIVFSLMLLSSVINIGERLRKIHFSVEIAFYVLVFFIIFFVIINPIRIILTSPSFEICTSLDPDSHKVRSVYRAVAKNMAKSKSVDDEHRLLLTKYNSYDELQMNMTVVFHDCIKKNLNNIIIKKAKTVLISTAICQNARMDMITVFSVNLNMIKDLVTECGFRPNMTNLSKLTVNVFSTALIAEGLESISVDDILPNSVNNALGQIPFIKPVMSSVTQGIANALLTIRIGCVTRKYLFRDGNVITKEDIRKSAFKDSLVLLPMVLYGTLTFIPKRIIHMFGSKNKENKKSAESDTLMIAD